MFAEKIEEMEDGKNKELLKLLGENAKPYIKKADGYAIKMDEDKEITYKDYDELEKTLKVPANSYVIVKEGCSSPDIITADEFESKNKFVESSETKKEKKPSKPTGLATLE